MPLDLFLPSISCQDGKQLSLDDQKEFEKKIIPFLEFSSKSTAFKTAYLIKNKTDEVLNNPFYKEVKIEVKTIVQNTVEPRSSKPVFETIQQTIKIPKETETSSSKNFDENEKADITIEIHIDDKGKPTIKNIVSPTYLKEFEDKWKTEAKRRGLEVNIPALRKQVHTDLENIAKENEELSFYKKFVQGTKALLYDNIASYVEGIAATQKIAKNVWAHGTINESTWHSKDFAEENKQWPEYCQFQPVVGGVQDGIIDEIVGIPMAIKGVYEIVTDDKKQDALKGMFTKEGMGKLYEGLKTEAKETLNDPEKGEHFAGQTTVSVVSMMSGVGLFTKAKKLDDVVETATDLSKTIPNPTTSKLLDDARKAARHVDNDKIAKELKQQIDEDLFDDFVRDGSEEIIAKGKKLSFKELQAFWKRGNDFNAKSKKLGWYENNEIWMTHPEKVYPKGHKYAGKPRRYRLDSWDKDTSMIVSRKATNLAEINKDTFIRYCKEISEKYPPGSKIANSEFGDKLFGKFYLEIPESNKNFDKINEYINLAKELDPPVTIIFKPE